jgi:hypothetical protein
VGLLGASAGLFSAQDQAPVFRASADAVAVNVSVRNGNNPVLGLTAQDFRLYDNDVLQHVEAVSMDAVPLDVSVVVDLSSSVRWYRDEPRDAVVRLVASLRPTDRFRVITMENAVVLALPWQRVGAPDTSMIHPVPGSISLVADSILMALAHRPDPARRHLVVALTDGEDLCSLTSGESLRRSAERSGAVFHWVNLDSSTVSRDGRDVRGGDMKAYYARVQGIGSTCKTFTRVPLRNFLSDAARLTGGSVHTAFSEADVPYIASLFNGILDDFRQSYILHYTPEGVPRGGWHPLRVELLKKRGKVRARPGYWGPENAQGAQ